MAPHELRPPIITLLTDFGRRDAYGGIMKGVILGLNPGARRVDLSHEGPPPGDRVQLSRSYPNER